MSDGDADALEEVLNARHFERRKTLTPVLAPIWQDILSEARAHALPDDFSWAIRPDTTYLCLHGDRDR